MTSVLMALLYMCKIIFLMYYVIFSSKCYYFLCVCGKIKEGERKKLRCNYGYSKIPIY